MTFEEFAKVGTFYGPEHEEHYSYRDAHEWVYDELSDNGEDELVGTVMVALVHKEFGAKQLHALADDPAEYLHERFADEYGRFDEGLHPDVVRGVRTALKPLIHLHLATEVYQCVEAATYTLTAADIRAVAHFYESQGNG